VAVVFDETVSDSEPPADAAAEQREEPTKRTAQSSAPTLSWAEVIEAEVDPAVVTNATLRDAIKATGLPWRVRDKGTNIEMLLIPPGEFVMGKSRGDDEAKENELPAHQVKLTKAFYLGRYEVTQQQYACAPSVRLDTLMRDGATRSQAEAEVRARKAPQSALNAKGEEWPVVQTSWQKCAAFCKEMDLRLPTEAEWEYACRAGTTTPRYGELDEIAWCQTIPAKPPHAVGTKQANALGLHDMLGNVAEWVNDRYGSYSEDAQTNPQGPSSGTDRVLRGSTYCHVLDPPPVCRASLRGHSFPDVSDVEFGFRVARTP